MTTLSARLGLKRHTTADAFLTSDYADNWNKLDQYPGEFICTSTTRPTWASAQAGQRIYETDSKLVWRWSGTVWERQSPIGALGRTAITANVSTNLTTFQDAVTVVATVPAGGRWIQITIAAPTVTSTASFTTLAIFRDSTQLTSWTNKGGVGATVQDQDVPSFVTVFDQPPAGTYTFALRYRADTGYGGTSTLFASATKPVAITVLEV